jgi:hypothetical protein
MHLNIVLNSVWFLLPGLGIMAGGVMMALVLQTWWPLLFVFAGLLLTVRLERDPVSEKFAELRRHSNCVIRKFHKQFFGVVGDFFVVGPFNRLGLDAAESLLERRDSTYPDVASASHSGLADGLTPGPPTGISAWRLTDIDRIAFATNSPSFTIIVQDNVEIHQSLGHTSVRDAVLKTLQPAVDWEIEEQFRKVFQLNVGAAVACLTLLFFTMALVLTIVGIIQPKQLPLVNWNDFRKMGGRGKGRGLLLIWVLLCETFLFFINNVHPSLVFALGVTSTIALIVVLYTSQWTQVAEITWRNPNSRSDHP